jgi:diguanylate cyclase (GGDEF)-like protein
LQISDAVDAGFRESIVKSIASSAVPGRVRMRFAPSVIRNPLWQRLALVCCATILLPLSLALVLGSHALGDGARREHDVALFERSRAVATSVAARVESANAVASALLAAHRQPDALADSARGTGVFLRTSIAGAGGVLPVPAFGVGGDDVDGAALISLPSGGDLANVYLVRRATVADREELVYFELSPQWLWKGLDPAARDLLVIDERGAVLFRGERFPEHAARIMAASVASRDASPPADAVVRVGWNADGSEWSGALARPPLPGAVRPDAAWHVGAARPRLPGSSSAEAWQRGAAAFLLGALALGMAGAAWLARQQRLPLVELRAALLRLGRSRFTALPVTSMPEEFRPLADAVNAAGMRLADDVAALETLGEIDRLLLGATELEPVLDAILSRVTTVTRCRTVGIALLDSDSPALGRVFVAAEGADPLPVTRVELDPELISSLIAADEGITIARCEEGRHSFLKPLRDLGSEFFWVWPVVTGQRLAAVLAVGFPEAPAQDPRFARHGSEFAARLAIALSKTARDEHLYRQAHYDPLTALPNRLLFRDRLAQEIAHSAESKTRGALLYIDLDHFKKVNDSVGHAAGDQLLVIVAQRLRACVKEGDTVARLAGDEFTVILRNVTDADSVSVVAERIIESIRMPVNLAGRDHYVQASIGMALFPDNGLTLEDLMRRADGAMYRAKDLGRGRAMFFDKNLMLKRFDTTQSGLYRALRQREFSLFYQPQYSLRDGSLVGLEALLRWQTSRDGTRSPDEFIPAAEVSGLIVDIGGWVLEAACAQLAVWREQGIAPGRLSVNVSVQQLKHAEFPRLVRRALEKYGIPSSTLEIEITESVLLDEAAAGAVRHLAELGVRLALDDFGTGYSSLNYLRQRPISVVKIDRSFLEDVPDNPASATLAETIISMAHALGKEVVAEGVETAEQLQFLRDRKCDHAQGFYFAKPLPAAQVGELLQARFARASGEELRDVG